jgi:hypothetical protein
MSDADCVTSVLLLRFALIKLLQHNQSLHGVMSTLLISCSKCKRMTCPVLLYVVLLQMLGHLKEEFAAVRLELKPQPRKVHL